MQALLLGNNKSLEISSSSRFKIDGPLPACLVPVKGDSLLGRWLDAVQALQKMDHIYVSVHHAPDLFFEALGKYIKEKRPTCPITVLYNPAVFGSAGILRQILPSLSQGLLVIQCENYFEEKEKDILRKLPYSKGSFACFNKTACYEKLSTSNVAHIVEGDIRFFQEKPRHPRGSHIHTGISYFSSQSLALIKKASAIDIATDVLPLVNKNKQLSSVILKQQYIDAFTPRCAEVH